MNAPSASEKVSTHWGANPPEWILALAKECEASSQNKAAKKIGFSPAVVSTILSNSYKGDYDTVQKAVSGAFMKKTVACPVLGDIPSNECLQIQKRPFSRANSTKMKLYKHCNGGCSHSRLGE